jgi:hypothetical protein
MQAAHACRQAQHGAVQQSSASERTDSGMILPSIYPCRSADSDPSWRGRGGLSPSFQVRVAGTQTPAVFSF